MWLFCEVPPRYVPQCLSELVTYNACELILICFIVTCVTVLKLQFDQSLWMKLSALSGKLYGPPKPNVPT